MQINFKEVDKKELIIYLSEILSDKDDKKIIVFGSIDNCIYDMLKDSINIFEKLYVGISKKYSTKKMIESLENFGNVFYQNNNDYRNMLKENTIILKNNKYTEIVIIPFELREEIIEKANNTIILIKFDNNENNIGSIDNFIKKYELNKLNYFKLDKNALVDLEKNKAFRNEKADTLYKEIDKDEIIKSFRTIQGVENKDEFLKMVEVNNKIRNGNFLKNEVEFATLDDNNDNSLTQNFDLDDDDIEFE